MGTVWRGLYEGPGADLLPAVQRSRVALKVLSAVRTPEKAWLDAFASEVRSIARLHHPNILGVFDFGEVSEEAEEVSQGLFSAGSPWLAMELADQGSLVECGAGMDWPDLQSMLLSLMQALGHAHARGVIHRDVKPANILFSGQARVLKLADFGVAVDVRSAQEGSLEGCAVGTPTYMAPEQFEGRTTDLGPWSDLYALGCIVYRMVCGRAPYVARGFTALREAHCTWPVPRLNPTMAVPDGLEAWIQTLLAKNPQARFSCVADARAALEGLDQVVPWGGVETITSAETTAISASTIVDSAPKVVQEPRRWVWPPPTIPLDWRPTDRPEWHWFRGVGLALHGVRTLPFVGRDGLRDGLWAVFQDVSANRKPAAVILDGPAGVGKSRLGVWLAQRTQELGAAEYMVGTHDPNGGPGMGVRAMLTRALGMRGATVQRAQDRMARLWRGLLDSDEREAISRALVGESDCLESERRALWHMALRIACHERPLVVVLEDVAWGLESVQFVQWILDQEPLPILFVLTVRTEDLADAVGVEETLRTLADHPNGHRLSVPPLAAADAGRLVGEGLGLRGDLAARVRERTAGNPLFAVQLVGDWVGRGILVPDAEGFHLAPGAQVRLPDDLHAIWSGRLDAFLVDRSEDAALALELAAVLGSVVDPNEWKRACDAMELDPGRVLDGLLMQGLAHQDPGEPEWSFVHGMARETLQRRARDGGRWAATNRVCAGIIRDADAQESRLGRHLLEAGQPTQSLAPLMTGMDRHLACGQLAQGQVVMEHQRRALDALAPDDPLQMWVRLQWVHLARLSGRIRAAEEELGRVRAMAESRDDVAGLTHVCTEEALIAYRAGRLEQVMDAAERGEALALQCDEVRLVARCREVRGRSCTDRAQFESATTSYAAAREAYETLGDELGMATCDLGLGWVALSLGQLEAALAHIVAALDVLKRLGARSTVAIAHNLLGEITRALGDAEQATVFYRRALSLHRACGSRGGAITAQLNLALVLVEQGDFAEARLRNAELLGAMVTQGQAQFLVAAQLIELVCDADQGRWKQWSIRFSMVETLLRESGQVHRDLQMLADTAHAMATAQGQTREAEQAGALAEGQRVALARD